MKIYGMHDDRTIQQLERCVAAEEGAIGVLCADGHVGYSMPIGGVVGYRNFVSESKATLCSTLHGAGRVMSRTQAAGKQKWIKGWFCGTRD